MKESSTRDLVPEHAKYLKTTDLNFRGAFPVCSHIYVDKWYPCVPPQKNILLK